jgi:hypothetical protein
MSTPFKMGNKFCLVRRGVRSLSSLRSTCTNPVPCTPSYVEQKCFILCGGVVMFTSCFTMGKAHGWGRGDSPNAGPDSATSKTHVLLTNTISQHQVNLWDFHQSTNVQAKAITLVPWLIQHWLYCFQKCWNSQKLFLPNQKNIVKDNSEYLGILHLLKWKFQN